MSKYKNQFSSLTSPFDMLNMLDQIGVTDPRIPVIADFMKLMSDENSGNQSSEKASIKKKRVIAMFNEIVRKNDELRNDNELLVDKLDIVASALGACPFCWGENETCDMCQGEGLPGRYKPDTVAFKKFVLPVVKKIRICAKKTKVSKQTEDYHKGLQENSIEFSKKKSKPTNYKLYNKAFLNA